MGEGIGRNQQEQAMIKVLVIEDHHLMLKAIVDQLEPQHDIKIVGTSNRGSQVHQLVLTTAPDVVILDLGMSTEIFEPISAVRELRRNHPNVQVLVLTGYDDELYVREITKAGARGYLLKSDDFSLNLPQAVRAVYRGDPHYSPAVVDKLLFGENNQHDFTEQELAAVRLLAKGLVNERIGEAMGVSERRVRNILTGVYAKMGIQEEAGVNPRVAAVIKAREMGLLPGE
jgi:DNA-binding NarL/FixJ family response regulator